MQEAEGPITLIPFFVLNQKAVELDIKIPPKGEKIRTIGRVKWNEFGTTRGSHYFCPGILMEEIGDGDKKWEKFVNDIEVNP